MTKELTKIFEFRGSHVRTVIDQHGNVWFVAADVCRVLEIGNVSQALARLDDDETTLISIEGASNGLPINVVNESGLYSLILGSRKPEAKAFKRWVTHEVIPAIRKTGEYSVNKIPTLEEALLAQQETASTALRLLRENKQLEAEKQQLELENQAMAPKAAFFDAVTSSEDLVPMGHAAKVLNLPFGRTILFRKLREARVLQRDNVPYQDYVDRGYFRVRQSKHTDSVGKTHIDFTTKVTGKGLDFLRKKFGA